MRTSLTVALVTVLVGGTAGLLLGLLAGYFGGWPDGIISRIGDIQLAFPSLLLAILLAGVLGPSMVNVIIALAVTRAADRVAIMYAGRIVETGTVAEVYERPAHPYTLGLMRAVPDPRDIGAPLEAIEGHPPDLTEPPAGCSFHPRCPFARDVCRTDDPAPRVLGPRRATACHFAEEVTAHADR
ncbi:hypothetical protein ITP53_31555 [Nonomuraea sp. K274]|uniref:Oligopeptide/dipeptide ABC transporter ATP-binding protein n=1 Tax=Nonomuraea cypriaca TaxID=1187855 RepID=A0A931AEL3_9ACTN|nr:oligopeptide/dipeptide ABC transporter ATP-binding protein [Nonomuraea cypriaca]MBF8190185.1 hypothetical protein [Nonomuraea cypriaca]